MTLAQILPPGGTASLAVMSSSTRASGASDAAARGGTGGGFADRLRQADAAHGAPPAAGDPGDAAAVDTTATPSPADDGATTADGPIRGARSDRDGPVADGHEASSAGGVTDGERASDAGTDVPAADAVAAAPAKDADPAPAVPGGDVDRGMAGLPVVGVPGADGPRPGDPADGDPTARGLAAGGLAAGGPTADGRVAGRPTTGDPVSGASTTGTLATGTPGAAASTTPLSPADVPASAVGTTTARVPAAGTPMAGTSVAGLSAAGTPPAGDPDGNGPNGNGGVVGLAATARPDVPVSGPVTSPRGPAVPATTGAAGEPAVADGHAARAPVGAVGNAGQHDARALAGLPGAGADALGGAEGRFVGQGMSGAGVAVGAVSVTHASVNAGTAAGATVAGAERAVAGVPAGMVVTAAATAVDGRSPVVRHARTGDVAAVATPTPGGGTGVPGSAATIIVARGRPSAGADTAAATGRPEPGAAPVVLPIGVTVAGSSSPNRAVRSHPDGGVDGAPVTIVARPASAPPGTMPPAPPMADATVMAARLVEARNRHADRVATTVVDDAVRLATTGRRVERPGASPLFGAGVTSFEVAGLVPPGPLDARATTLPGTPLGHLAGPSLVSRVDIAPLPIAPHSVPLDGSSNGAGELAAGIRWTLGEGRGHALVNVTPAGLGPVNIRVSVEPDHVSVSIVAAQLGAREALESLIPRLREQLAADGHDKVQVDVSGGQQDRAGPGTSSRDDGQDGTGTGRATTENATTRDAEHLTRTATQRLDPRPTASSQGRSLIDAWA